jgi:membrane protease YdiL (CAAX protease family)
MRAFGWFVGLLILAMVSGALLAYPAFELVAGAGWRFDRVASRVAMLVFALELVWLCRHLNIRTKTDFGYGLPWRRFASQCLIWGVIGMLTAAGGAAFLLGTNLRALAPGFMPGVGAYAHLLLIGIGSGISVALIEESVMRGALHTAIARESGHLAAATLTATLFAILHFFAKARIAPNELAWYSGFDLLLRSFAPLAHPVLVLDSLLAWLVVFLILAGTRVLTGNIAVAIGLHAGWVVVLRMLQEATTPTAAAQHSVWVGSFDGLLGYWMLPWGTAIAVALWLSRAWWVPAASRPLHPDETAGERAAPPRAATR